MKGLVRNGIVREKEKCETHSVVCDFLWPHGPYSPWNSPGKNTRVGSHSPFQEIFSTRGLNPGLLHCGWVFFFFFTVRTARGSSHSQEGQYKDKSKTWWSSEGLWEIITNSRAEGGRKGKMFPAPEKRQLCSRPQMTCPWLTPTQSWRVMKPRWCCRERFSVQGYTTELRWMRVDLGRQIGNSKHKSLQSFGSLCRRVYDKLFLRQWTPASSTWLERVIIGQTEETNDLRI